MYKLMDYLTQCSKDYRGDLVSYHNTIADARKRMTQIKQSWIKGGFTVHESNKDDIVLKKEVWFGNELKIRYIHIWIEKDVELTNENIEIL